MMFLFQPIKEEEVIVIESNSFYCDGVVKVNFGITLVGQK